MFKQTAVVALVLSAMVAPAVSFSVGSGVPLRGHGRRLASNIVASRAVPSLALASMSEGSSALAMPLGEEKRLFGSRRLHRWFGKNSASQNEEAKEEIVHHRQSSYVEVQPLVALMSKRRLTEYYFTTMGPTSFTLDDSEDKAVSAERGAAFLEEHLKGVPDVLNMNKNDDMYSNAQEHLFEKTA